MGDASKTSAHLHPGIKDRGPRRQLGLCLVPAAGLVPEVLVVAQDVNSVERLQRCKEAFRLLVSRNVQMTPRLHELGEGLEEPASGQKGRALLNFGYCSLRITSDSV